MEESPKCVAELQGIALNFGEKEVLRDVNLKVFRGERLVILGQSGCGKSTILRLILGVLHPAHGRLFFQGSEIGKMSHHDLNLARQKIGMVYQSSALISSLTVRENLSLPLAELTEKLPGEIDHLVRQKLEMVDLIDSIDQMPGELSGGMRKRVGLARGIMLDPELLLLDEPSAGLDPVISSVVDDLIIKLTETTGTTSVIVTHEMGSAFKIATRMAMLFEGRMIANGAPEEFYDSDNAIVAQFVSGSTEGPIQEHASAKLSRKKTLTHK